MKKLFLASLMIFIIQLLPAEVYRIETIPNIQLKDSTQFVSNPDNIISSSAVATINRELQKVRQVTTAEVAVVLVGSIGQNDIKQFATELFAHWGIGKRDRDNGLLILFVSDQKKITFETGYGIEGILPDAICKRIQTVDMLPHFRRGDIDQGMVAGVTKTANYLLDEDVRAEIKSQMGTTIVDQAKSAIPWYMVISFGVAIFFAISIFFSLNSKSDRYDKYRNIVGYKVPVIIFTVLFPALMIFVLLFFLWKKKSLRNGKHKCDKCGASMSKLSEEDDDFHLTEAERIEERIQSVDYDVWVCSGCSNKKIYKFDSAYSKYRKCPQCKAKTFALSSDRVLRTPTPLYEGSGQREYFCQHCQYKLVEPYTLPRIVVLPPPGGRRGGGGFGGGMGGFGGGGFGGGRSGGGGATSGW